jgi:hypothetical protein
VAVFDTTYDPETIAVMTRALNEAWHELEGMNVVGPAVVRRIMSLRIVTALHEGVREPTPLRILALHAIGRCHIFV